MIDADMVIHIVDDEEAVRMSLAFLLMSTGYSVRVHDCSKSVLAATHQGGNACIITDLFMPDMSGMELLRSLRIKGNKIPVVIMTGESDVSTAVEAMKAGAADFLEKPFSDTDLLKVLQKVSDDGQAVVADTPDTTLLALLTPREREVLDAMVAGLPNKMTAERLDISPRTVEIHRANLMAKLHVRSLAELVRLVIAP